MAMTRKADSVLLTSDCHNYSFTHGKNHFPLICSNKFYMQTCPESWPTMHDIKRFYHSSNF